MQILKTYKNFLHHTIPNKEAWLLTMLKNGIITQHTFEMIILSKITVIKLLEQCYTHMTIIQSTGIPLQLCGFDVLGSAQTGSGKTLAYCIPIIEFVYTIKWLNSNGTASIILTPTRELTLQNYYIIKDLGHFQSNGIVIGGSNKKKEVEKIQKGLSILVATPGRLLDHLKDNSTFKFINLQILIIDETDRCLEIGFEEEICQILSILPKKRQTILFSATQTKKIENLSVISFIKKPIYLALANYLENSAIPSIEQNFLICNSQNRFGLLICFLKKNMNKKIIAFFNSCNEVKFFSTLIRFLGINVLDLHGKQKQFKRTVTFFNFCKTNDSILFCTDIASRGLDIPSIDWIFHIDIPLELKNYLHRVGRVCRGVDRRGKSLIFLLPSEINFLILLKKNNIKIKEYKVQTSNLDVISHTIMNIVNKNNYLLKLSKMAFKSFLNSYSSSTLKGIFDLKKINLNLLSKGFGIHINYS